MAQPHPKQNGIFSMTIWYLDIEAIACDGKGLLLGMVFYSHTMQTQWVSIHSISFKLSYFALCVILTGKQYAIVCYQFYHMVTHTPACFQA